MVFMHFPQHLTEEEEMLQKKYAKLRKKKKALASLRAPKSEASTPEIELKGKKRSAEAAADAMEKAKKLLKSGAIKVEVEKKDTAFKRTKRQKEQDKAAVSFTPFSPTHLPGPAAIPEYDENKEADRTEVSRPRMKGLYDSFVSSKEPKVERDREERKERDPPKRGNTIYIHGLGITEDIIRRTFSNFGNIVHINMEKEKNCGFLTYEKMDSADQAINEMGGSMVAEIHLQVSMARRQPNFETQTDPANSTWSSIAASQSQKSTYKDKRDLVTYEEEDFF